MPRYDNRRQASIIFTSFVWAEFLRGSTAKQYSIFPYHPLCRILETYTSFRIHLPHDIMYSLHPHGMELSRPALSLSPRSCLRPTPTHTTHLIRQVRAKRHPTRRNGKISPKNLHALQLTLLRMTAKTMYCCM
jgi:hypothetical protein